MRKTLLRTHWRPRNPRHRYEPHSSISDHLQLVSTDLPEEELAKRQRLRKQKERTRKEKAHKQKALLKKLKRGRKNQVLLNKAKNVNGKAQRSEGQRLSISPKVYKPRGRSLVVSPARSKYHEWKNLVARAARNAASN